MSVPTFAHSAIRARAGVKGPRAAEWLRAQAIALPSEPNTWTECGDALLVARLGASEFFIEGGGSDRDGAGGGGAGGGGADGGGAGGETVCRIVAALETPAAGVYPVLREDAAFVLAGDGTHEVLAQVCNVNFGALDLVARPVIMTLVLGVAVLIVPQSAAAGVQYRIWCDPTFGAYLDGAIGQVVIDCGGSHSGVSA